MTRETATKIAAVQEQAAADPEYLALLEEYRMRGTVLLELMQRLLPEDAAIIEDYLGLVAEMHGRQLEYACK